ncbi:uroporphyrinogen-III synthase [Chitinibacter tainanensis]|uniref:uroporphyrinogen-III synthase n=1 Tax=Chitinibacter tainanensis TaxID=230667 RepID=UPI000401C860|nr:uroporphyrinogen-III synthase [Chitinibacter tainanensis]
MTKALAGRRLWITRPAGQAAVLAQALAAAGADTLLWPLLEIVPPSDAAPLDAALRNLAQFQLAVFVSPSALDCVFERLQHLQLSWPAELPAAVVGPGSARRAQALGISTIISPAQQFDSEGLLAEPALQTLAGQAVVLFRGHGGRELLPVALAERGAQLHAISAYQRQGVRWPEAELLTQLAAGCDGVIVSSSEAAQHLFAIGGEATQHQLQSRQYFAPHPRIVAALQAHGAQRVELTAAGDLGITTSICQHFSHE